MAEMNYKVIDREQYYRKGVFRHFSEDCKCSVSMTARVDVTDLVRWSKANGTRFYINFLYVLSKVLNSREDYRMAWLWQSGELMCSGCWRKKWGFSAVLRVPWLKQRSPAF